MADGGVLVPGETPGASGEVPEIKEAEWVEQAAKQLVAEVKVISFPKP